MFKEKYFGDKAFYKYVLTLAFPMMLQGLLISLAGLVDNMMVAGLGDSFLSGVAAANRFYIIFNFAITGVSLAAGIFIGQYFGAGNKQKIKESFRAAIILSYILTIPFFILMKYYPTFILRFFTSDLSVISSGLDYYRGVVWTVFPVALTIVTSVALRSIGDTKTPIYASIIGIIVNMSLNFVLIYGKLGFEPMGVYGAAIATLVSRFVEIIVLLWIVKINDFAFKTRIKNLFKIEKSLFVLITKNAINIASNEILWGLSMAFLMKFYSSRGPAAMSAYSIAGSIADLFFVLFGGMSAATTVLVGHNLGANNFDKAKENANRLLALSFMMAVFFGILLFILSNFIPYIYRDVSKEAQDISIILTRIIGVLFWTYMYNVQILFMLRAGGDSLSAFIMDSGFMWLFNLPLVGFFTYFTDLPITYLYLIGQATDVVKLSVSTFVYKKEYWIKNITHY